MFYVVKATGFTQEAPNSDTQAKNLVIKSNEALGGLAQ